ncbi:chemotaxis protein CheB [Pedobacter mucosus]|uniref:chemotaxis protein CheB n=1 Tax=Pedobacter mucosus TaxID=2895286 RepID=UPI001EE49AF0|nr:chemotaxis protein CheB [Pedobacter mucosus]UKT62989.1 chemotaxis protein CheB [Pedobacter mucosus]
MSKKYIVAIGASAGGLNAIAEFFDHTLPDGISNVITTHLDPTFTSQLASIIQNHSDIKVCTVEHNMAILANTIYVMPENKTMKFEFGKFVLTPRDLTIKINKVIDTFFISLAKDTSFEKIALIFSGMGIDGTEGVKALSKNGAYILIQTPHSAEEESMPTNIIELGYAAKVLDPKDMPAAIIDYIAGH